MSAARDATDPIPEVRVPDDVVLEMLVAVLLVGHAAWRWWR